MKFLMLIVFIRCASASESYTRDLSKKVYSVSRVAAGEYKPNYSKTYVNNEEPDLQGDTCDLYPARCTVKPCFIYVKKAIGAKTTLTCSDLFNAQTGEYLYTQLLQVGQVETGNNISVFSNYIRIFRLGHN